MSMLWIESTFFEFCIILLDVSYMGFFKKFVTGIHLYGKRIKGIDDFLGVGDDGLFGIGQFCQKMPFDAGRRGLALLSSGSISTNFNFAGVLFYKAAR